MLKDCEHDGSTMLRVEKLKTILNQSYSHKYSGGLSTYIERLQTTIEELSTLLSLYANEEIKMEVLTSALRKASDDAYYLDYIQDHQLDFATACGYLREWALIKETFHDNSKHFNRLSNHTNSAEDQPTEFTQVYTIMQNWAQETGQDLTQVYATMNSSPLLHDNLMIPSVLWTKLAPEIKKAIMDTRRNIQQDQAKSSSHAHKEPTNTSRPVPK